MNENNKLYQDIREILIDVLALEDTPEIVVPSATFTGDLGGESIELLELGFRIERRLGVRVNLQEIFGSKNLETNDQGLVTKSGLKNLKERFPYLNYKSLSNSSSARNPKDLFSELLTVEAIVELVREAIIKNNQTVSEATVPDQSPN